jgi:LAO/AO transport system kinase
MGLLNRAVGGDGAALARLATLLENDDPAALDAIDAQADSRSLPYVIGLTGPPGAGKSSLINALLPHLQHSDKTAILLVDPSSQKTGGAVLGDRVRMFTWGDDRLFIRSMATRGQEGGLAPATGALIDLFALTGFGTVIVETVGVGQDGIDIQAVADTTIVAQSPQTGDAVQALKAGILEIADIFVVTKADLTGAHSLVRDLNTMIHLGSRDSSDWTPQVVAVSATKNEGLEQLQDVLSRHCSYITERGRLDRKWSRERWEIEKRAANEIRKMARRSDLSEESGLTRRQRTAQLMQTALAGLERPD